MHALQDTGGNNRGSPRWEAWHLSSVSSLSGEGSEQVHRSVQHHN